MAGLREQSRSVLRERRARARGAAPLICLSMARCSPLSLDCHSRSSSFGSLGLNAFTIPSNMVPKCHPQNLSSACSGCCSYDGYARLWSVSRCWVGLPPLPGGRCS